MPDATPAATTKIGAALGASLTVDRVAHRYGDAVALEQISLDVAGGELVSLLGPSGCGKTTLLRIIGGFLAQSAGRVLIDGQPVDHLPANRRAVGIVFQSYALFPHMTVARNIAYGLEARRRPRAEIRARVAEMLALVRLEALAGRMPRELSGGQQQRVALARALAVRPAILLLDEPFAALDKNLRLDMQIEVKRIQRLSGTTTVLVTHDQEEALSLSDRIAVLNQGRLEQLAPPTTVYDRPASLFVNTFVGAANVLPGVVLSGGTGDGGIDGAGGGGPEGGGAGAGDAGSRKAGTGETGTGGAAGVVVGLDGGGRVLARRPVRPVAAGEPVVVCIRPEHLRIGADGPGDTGWGLAGTVGISLPLGATIVHEIRTAAGAALKVAEPRETGAEPRAAGSVVTLRPVSPDAVNVFPAAT